MSYTTLTYEVRDEVGIVALNRPEARNALDMDMRRELGELVFRVRDDKDLKALIITGNGGAFCAGGDLKSLAEDQPTASAGRDRVAALHSWFFELVNLEKPVIAAVDGPAFGAGFNLALAADFVLATPRATFCQVFGRIGVVPDLGGFFLLPRIVGLQKAKQLIFSARVVGAEEALDLGIAYEIVPQEGLMDAAMALADNFRHASTLAIGLAKRALNQSLNSDYHAVADMESYAQGLCFSSDYHRAAVARFVGKQPLAFNWETLQKQAAE